MVRLLSFLLLIILSACTTPVYLCREGVGVSDKGNRENVLYCRPFHGEIK